MRLAFSIATAINPEILLVDEVLSVGDMAFQRKCLDRVRALRREGRTIIFISHDLNAVEALCDRLLWTCYAITLALAIFVINYRKLIEQRGWAPPDFTSQPKAMRFEDLRQVIEVYARYNSFTVVSAERRGDELFIKLQTKPRGIDQTEQILFGGPSGSRGCDKPVRYEQALVAETALGLLQRTVLGVEGYARYSLEIVSEVDAVIGAFVITSAALEKVGGPKDKNLDKDRQLAEVDTLRDARMWVKVEEAPQPLSGARARRRGR